MAGNPSIINSDLVVLGQFSANSMAVPSGSVGNSQVAVPATATGGIASSKLQDARSIPAQLFGPTTAVTAVTQTLTIIVGTGGTLIDFSAFINVAATGSDRTITLDLQKSTGGGAFASVLSATFGFTHSSTPLTLVKGTITSASVVAGDILEVIVTVAGSSSAQATGLTVCLRHDESYS